MLTVSMCLLYGFAIGCLYLTGDASFIVSRLMVVRNANTALSTCSALLNRDKYGMIVSYAKDSLPYGSFTFLTH